MINKPVNKLAIITDSNSGIDPQMFLADDVYVIPMPIIIDGVEYFENVNLSHEEFFEKLYSDSRVTTSQPSPSTTTKMFDDLLVKGYQELLYIPMSSALSSSFATAKMLAEDYAGKVQIVDNHRVSITQKHSVLDAIKLKNDGLNALEIKEKLEATAYDSLIFVAVDTLDYLVRGGRISKTAASMANLINIKPLLIITGEKLDAFTKTRGLKKCKRVLISESITYIEKAKAEGYDVDVTVTGSLSKEEIEDWVKEINEAIPGYDIQFENLSLSISTHVGKGTYGIGISKKII